MFTLTGQYGDPDIFIDYNISTRWPSSQGQFVSHRLANAPRFAVSMWRSTTSQFDQIKCEMPTLVHVLHSRLSCCSITNVLPGRYRIAVRGYLTSGYVLSVATVCLFSCLGDASVTLLAG